ncbi:MAG: glycosyltransferase family 39 protein [Oscillospiraceae bacterium]|jgi:hypothetical protein|nr:glycosyltransferase family 39 protein [Oscillospiraceae bacterium]
MRFLKTLNRIVGKAGNAAYAAIAAIFLFFMAVLCVLSLFFTTGMDTFSQNYEHVFIQNESVSGVFLNIAIVILAVLIGVLLRKIAHKIPPSFYKRLPWLVAVWTILLGVIWVMSSHSMPFADTGAVVYTGRALSNNDFSKLFGENASWYFVAYRYQLGFTFWCELVYRVMRPGTHFEIFQLLNVLFLAGSYFCLLKTLGRVFKRDLVVLFCALFMLLAPQPIMTTVLIYGNLPGLFFTIAAVWFAVLFLESHKWYYGLLTGSLLGIAAVMKANTLIVLIAVCIIIALDFIRHKNFRSVVTLVVSVACCISFPKIVTWQYEMRAGSSFSVGGVPMISWMALGLSDQNGYDMPGWYASDHTIWAYELVGRDTEKAAELAKTTIKEELKALITNPRYGISFFYKKFSSQWNEPTYQSVWINQGHGFYAEREGIAALICGTGEHTEISTGPLEAGVKGYVNLLNMAVFVCVFTAAGALLLAKKKSIVFLLLPTVILGGVAYHLLFEAKSQYILAYFVLMLPIAAAGLDYLSGGAEKALGRILKKPAAKAG